MIQGIGGSVFRALALLLVVGVPSLWGQDGGLIVTDSVNQTEVRLPDAGWRRAVVGRPVPAGSVVTAWIDSRVVIEQENIVVQVESMTHMTVGEAGPLRLGLTAGAVRVDTTRPAEVAVAARDALVSTTDAAFVVTPNQVTVERGTVLIERSDVADLVVEAGNSVPLGLFSPGSIIPSH